MPGAIIAKVYRDPSNGPNNCEVWIQGPEPSTTRLATLVEATPTNIPVVTGLQLDVWYDLYAKAPDSVPGNYTVLISTVAYSGGFPAPGSPCCGNGVVYPFWDASNVVGNWVVRRRDIGYITWENGAASPVPAGATRYLGSIRLTTTANTTQPANPVPPNGTPTPTPSPSPSPTPPGGGGGGFPPIPWPDLSFITPEMWLIGGAAVVGLVVSAAVAGGGGDD